MKKIVNKLYFIKIKMFCEKQCQENKKSRQRFGENICKRHD